MMKLNQRKRVDLRKHQKAIDGVKAAAVAVSLGALALLGSTATAHADSQDTVFLRAIHGRGISSDKGDGFMIQMAYNVCETLAEGMSMNGLTQALSLHNRNGMTTADTAFFVQTSAAAYCPQYIR
jgi:hypothetical protein